MRCLLLLSAICVSDIWHLHNFEVTSVFINLQFTIHTCMNICDWTFSIIYVYIERNNAVCIQVNVQHVHRCVPALYDDMDHSTVYIHVHNNSVYVHVCTYVCTYFIHYHCLNIQSRYMSERKLEPKDVPGTFLNLVSCSIISSVRMGPQYVCTCMSTQHTVTIHCVVVPSYNYVHVPTMYVYLCT